ncbi:MAG TPA: ABC transporter permease [Kofleriaceae bacterium]|nr:ABC transporter permease [Kofleriaceae bacterium]
MTARDLRAAIRSRLAGADIDPRREAEIVDELALHLEERHAELRARGASADEATARALEELDVSDVLAARLARVAPRDGDLPVTGAPRRGLLTDLWRDLRHAARALRRSPVFTAVTLLSLALGIGANTAIFQLLDSIHLRALPVPAPDELVTVRVKDRTWAKGMFNGWHADLTYPLFQQLRDNQQAFSRVAAWSDRTINLAPSGHARWAAGLLVSGDFFSVLGIAPAAGRLLSTADDQRGCRAPGVVVSHGFWQRELGGDPAAIGRPLALDGHHVPIVGVTPASFFGPEVGRSFDVALPICMVQVLRPQPKSWLEIRHAWWLSVIGRLRPGWSIAKASAHLASLSPALMDATVPEAGYYSPDNIAAYRAYRLAAYPAATGISDLRERYTAPLYFLLATAGLVLLIACANLANLLLARATAREREIAVRLAIGASPRRLIRQLMTESLLLAALGAALALLLARGLSGLLVASLSTRDRVLSVGLDADLRVVGFTAGLAALTCVLFGLAPALQAARTDVGVVLRMHAMSAVGGRLRLRRALVVTQVALSFVLVAGALLFTRSFRNLVTVDTGFRAEGVLVLSARLPTDLAPDRLAALHPRILDRVRGLPAVESAAAAAIAPVSGDFWDNYVWLDGVEPPQRVDAFFNRISPGYFRTLGTQLVAGRDFRDTDTTQAPSVVIIDEELARQLLHGANPLGRRLSVEPGSREAPAVYEIVGLVRDAKYGALREDRTPLVYVPTAQNREPETYSQLVIRAAGPLAAVAAAAEQAVTEIVPSATLDWQALDDEIRETLRTERLLAALSGFFGLLAALLAGIGLYGVVAYSVARRTHEIGIRMALGATRRRISAMFLGEAIRLLAAGLAVGVAVSLLAGRAAGSLLYGLAPRDPLTLVLAGAVLAAITCLASVLPAWRAASVDPMAALRDE